MDGSRDEADAIVPSPSHRTAFGRLLAAGVIALAAVGVGAGGAAARPTERAPRGAPHRTNRATRAVPGQDDVALRVVTQEGLLRVNQSLTLTAACSSGEIATGGGYDVDTSTAGVFVQKDPPKQNPPNAWTATFINTGRQNPKVTTFVVCMNTGLPGGGGRG